MRIAITGGMGSGKSTVVEELKKLFPKSAFYSMDKFVDELYQEESWLNWLQAKFNTTDRKAISKLVFADATLRNELNLQSALKVGLKLGKALQGTGELVFVEFPLLFEARMEDEFDITFHITADLETRVNRVIARDNKSRDHILMVMNAQMPEEEKQKLAYRTIDTTSATPTECASKIRGAICFYIAVKAGIFNEDGSLSENYR